MGTALKFYLRMLNTRPYLTQAVSTGAIMTGGDIICQLGFERKTLGEYDSSRTLRFAVIGTFAVGPVLRGWYNVLDRIFGTSGGMAGLKKMVVDQTVFAPALVGTILSMASLMQGRSLGETRKHLQQEYLQVMKTNYLVWPATQSFNFYLVPLKFRVLFANMVGLFWNCYLSQKSNTNQPMILNKEL